jgi:hypothetical protein
VLVLSRHVSNLEFMYLRRPSSIPPTKYQIASGGILCFVVSNSKIWLAVLLKIGPNERYGPFGGRDRNKAARLAPSLFLSS